MIILGIVRLEGTKLNKHLPEKFQQITDHFGVLMEHEGNTYTQTFTTKVPDGFERAWTTSENITRNIDEPQHLIKPIFKIGTDLYKFKTTILSDQFYMKYKAIITQTIEKSTNWIGTPMDAIDLTIFIAEKFNT